MRSWGSVLGKFSPTQLAKSLSQTYSQLRQTVRGEMGVVEVGTGLFQLDYPQAGNVGWLAGHIAGAEYMVWNLSEYQYEDGFDEKLVAVSKGGEVHRLCYQYYSGPPFLALLAAIDRIAKFLKEKPKGKVYVHCQEGKVRSAVFLSCYLTRTGGAGCIGEAVGLVNRLLGVKLEQGSSSQASHHLLIKNFINYLTDPRFINPFSLQLTALSVSGLPNLHRSEGQELSGDKAKVFLQLWCEQRLAWKGSGVREGGEVVWAPRVGVSDQFLVVVKYVVQNQAYRVMRLQMNTNFIFQQRLKVQKHNIDFSSNAVQNGDNTCVHLSFKQLTQHSLLAQLGRKEEKQIQTDLLELSKAKEKQVVPQSNFDVKGEGLEQLEVDLSGKIDELMRSMAERQEKEKAEVEQYIDSEEQQQQQCVEEMAEGRAELQIDVVQLRRQSQQIDMSEGERELQLQQSGRAFEEIEREQQKQCDQVQEKQCDEVQQQVWEQLQQKQSCQKQQNEHVQEQQSEEEQQLEQDLQQYMKRLQLQAQGV